jgi:thiamine-monophosphate kinase
MQSEFEFIDNIKKRFGLEMIGDDCAVLPKDNEADMVVTADLLVEDWPFPSPTSLRWEARLDGQ